jgi:hypothetical protein
LALGSNKKTGMYGEKTNLGDRLSALRENADDTLETSVHKNNQYSPSSNKEDDVLHDHE